MKKNGITLIELIVTLGILSIVIMLIYGILNSGMRFYSKGVDETELQDTQRGILMYIKDNIRLSDAAAAAEPVSGSTGATVFNSSKPVPDRFRNYNQTDEIKLLYVKPSNPNLEEFMLVLKGQSSLKQLYRVTIDSYTLRSTKNLIADNVVNLLIKENSIDSGYFEISGDLNIDGSTKHFNTSISKIKK